ncbi:MAG: Hsp20/alpha crystallin family protein, partial [Myxococcota bacterium]
PLPGLSQKDVEIEANHEVVTIRGKRNITAPEGYRVQRQERSDLQFSRSLALPVNIDPEKVKAELKHGLLSIKMGKAKEALPQKIKITT